MDSKRRRTTKTLLGLSASLVLVGALIGSPVGASGAKKVEKCQGKVATIVSNKKKIKGTNKADVIVSKSNNNVIDGRKGPDLICSGGDSDVVEGGGGADKIYGEGGKDLVLGSAGDDKVYGGPGNDLLGGQAGRHDLCTGGPGSKDAADKKSCERIKSAKAV